MKTGLILIGAVCEVLVLAGGAQALEINPTFTNGGGETWDSTRQGVINQAIADWELSIFDTQSVDVTFKFSHTGTSSYLGLWGGSISASVGTDIYPWTSGVSHTIYFNADLFYTTNYLWWDPTPGTSDDQPFAAYDALSVARHEMGHMMGFTDDFYVDDFFGDGEHDRWTDQIVGTTFDPGGLNVAMASSGDLGHVADSVPAIDSDLMATATFNSIRRDISQMDRDMLALAHGYSVLISDIPGDVDGNGYVSGPDLTTIITNWGMTGASLEQGDLNGDGTVSGPDYTEVITFWGTGTPPPEPVAIPEPATLGLLVVGGLAILRRRRA